MLVSYYNTKSDLEDTMKTQLLIGIISLAVAAVLLLLGWVEVIRPMGNGTLSVYPAGFFALLGVVLVFRSLKHLA
jgi:uncharacterized membrane protein